MLATHSRANDVRDAAEAKRTAAQLVPLIISYPLQISDDLKSSEVKRRHKLLGVSPEEPEEFLVTKLPHHEDNVNVRVLHLLDILRLQHELASDSADLIGRLYFTCPEPDRQLAALEIGHPSAETADSDTPLLALVLKFEPDGSENVWKFDNLLPFEADDYADWIDNIDPVDDVAPSSTKALLEDLPFAGTQSDVNDQRVESEDKTGAEYISDADAFWSGFDDEDQIATDNQTVSPSDDHDNDDAAEQAYWERYDDDTVVETHSDAHSDVTDPGSDRDSAKSPPNAFTDNTTVSDLKDRPVPSTSSIVPRGPESVCSTVSMYTTPPDMSLAELEAHYRAKHSEQQRQAREEKRLRKDSEGALAGIEEFDGSSFDPSSSHGAVKELDVADLDYNIGLAAAEEDRKDHSGHPETARGVSSLNHDISMDSIRQLTQANDTGSKSNFLQMAPSTVFSFAESVEDAKSLHGLPTSKAFPSRHASSLDRVEEAPKSSPPPNLPQQEAVKGHRRPSDSATYFELPGQPVPSHGHEDVFDDELNAFVLGEQPDSSKESESVEDSAGYVRKKSSGRKLFTESVAGHDDSFVPGHQASTEASIRAIAPKSNVVAKDEAGWVDSPGTPGSPVTAEEGVAARDKSAGHLTPDSSFAGGLAPAFLESTSRAASYESGSVANASTRTNMEDCPPSESGVGGGESLSPNPGWHKKHPGFSRTVSSRAAALRQQHLVMQRQQALQAQRARLNTQKQRQLQQKQHGGEPASANGSSPAVPHRDGFDEAPPGSPPNMRRGAPSSQNLRRDDARRPPFQARGSRLRPEENDVNDAPEGVIGNQVSPPPSPSMRSSAADAGVAKEKIKATALEHRNDAIKDILRGAYKLMQDVTHSLDIDDDERSAAHEAEFLRLAREVMREC